MPDHIQYINPTPDAELVADVADFLIAKGVRNKGRADKIQDYFRDLAD